MAHVAESPIGSILRFAEGPEFHSLAAGSPAPELFAPEAVAAAAAQLLGDGAALQYGDTTGFLPLREWIADREALGERSTGPDASGVVLTHGSQQALDLVCKALLDPGDAVVVDDPSYVGALQVFRLFQADVVPVPLADDPELAALEGALAEGLRPRFLYVVADFSNPTGSRLSVRQRARLAELAERYGFLLVEDDPYGDLGYGDAPRRPPLASFSDRVIRLGSFSKVLFPAARLGYLVSPAVLAPAFHTLKQAADLGNSAFMERLVHTLVSEPGYLEARIAAARTLYRGRRDALVTAVREQFGRDLAFRVPDGGFFLWARLAGSADAEALLRRAVGEKVSFVPGAAFYGRTGDRSTLRLSFSAVPAEAMEEAVARLRTAWCGGRRGNSDTGEQ